MKKILPIIFIGILIVLGVFQKNTDKSINYSIEDKNYKLLVADQPGEWEKGLMYARNLKNEDGMIFIFPDYKTRSFWNKNTYVDLNLLWISDKKIVGRSYLPSVEKVGKVVVVSSPKPVDKVVELLIK